MTYEWKETRRRDGSIEYRLQCPLMRGEHRPVVLVSSPQQTQSAAQGIMRWGNVFATSIHGYSRQFHDVDEAKQFAGDVPMDLGGFARKETV